MTTRSVLLLALLLPAAAGAQSFAFVDAWFDGEVQGAMTIDGLADAVATAVSPGGDHVYVCSGISGQIGSDNAIAVFSRSARGELSFVQAISDADAEGLSSCRDVVVSPDGKHVYTAGFSDSAIGIFGRAAATGILTFQSVVKDGVGLDGLAGVESLAITGDGAFLFAAGSIDDALVAFARDGVTGALTFEDDARNGFGGVTSLDRPLDVAVSPDDKHVYAVAGSNQNFTGSDAVTAFGWDGVAGNLTFLGDWRESDFGVDGLDRVSGVTVSPDGLHVYATGGLDPFGDHDWIAVFSRSSATGLLTWRGSVDHFVFCDFDILFGFETYAVIHPQGERFFVTSSATAGDGIRPQSHDRAAHLRARRVPLRQCRALPGHQPAAQAQPGSHRQAPLRARPGRRRSSRLRYEQHVHRRLRVGQHHPLVDHGALKPRATLVSMDPETWRRVKELCGDVLERPAGERPAFVAESCGGDPELEGELLALLAAHDEAETTFLGEAAPEESPVAPRRRYGRPRGAPRRSLSARA